MYVYNIQKIIYKLIWWNFFKSFLSINLLFGNIVYKAGYVRPYQVSWNRWMPFIWVTSNSLFIALTVYCLGLEVVIGIDSRDRTRVSTSGSEANHLSLLEICENWQDAFVYAISGPPSPYTGFKWRFLLTKGLRSKIKVTWLVTDAGVAETPNISQN